MRVVVALEVAHDLEVANVGEAVDRRDVVGAVVARQGQVHARAGVTGGHEVDGVAHQLVRARVRMGVVRRVRSDQDHVARHGRRPHALGLVEEAYVVKRAAVRVGHNDGLVLGKVGRRHAVPLILARAHVRLMSVACLVSPPGAGRRMSTSPWHGRPAPHSPVRFPICLYSSAVMLKGNRRSCARLVPASPPTATATAAACAMGLRILYSGCAKARGPEWAVANKNEGRGPDDRWQQQHTRAMHACHGRHGGEPAPSLYGARRCVHPQASAQLVSVDSETS